MNINNYNDTIINSFTRDHIEGSLQSTTTTLTSIKKNVDIRIYFLVGATIFIVLLAYRYFFPSNKKLDDQKITQQDQTPPVLRQNLASIQFKPSEIITPSKAIPPVPAALPAIKPSEAVMPPFPSLTVASLENTITVTKSSPLLLTPCRPINASFALENAILYEKKYHVNNPKNLDSWDGNFDFNDLFKRNIDMTGSTKHLFKFEYNQKQYVASKLSRTGGLKSGEWKKELINARLLAQLPDCPYILRYVGIANSNLNEQEILISEYCDDALFRVIETKYYLLSSGQKVPSTSIIVLDTTLKNDENRKNKYICQLASVVYHFHSYGFAHGDIKIDNILVKQGNICLCDFDQVSSLLDGREILVAKSRNDVRALANVIVSLEGSKRVIEPESYLPNTGRQRHWIAQEVSDEAIIALPISEEKKKLLLAMTRYEINERIDLDQAYHEIMRLWSTSNSESAAATS